MGRSLGLFDPLVCLGGQSVVFQLKMTYDEILSKLCQRVGSGA